jgi:hypothetical protein
MTYTDTTISPSAWDEKAEMALGTTRRSYEMDVSSGRNQEVDRE